MAKKKRALRNMIVFALVFSCAFVLFSTNKLLQKNKRRFERDVDPEKLEMLSKGDMSQLRKMYSHLVENEDVFSLLERFDEEPKPGRLVCDHKKRIPLDKILAGKAANDPQFQARRESVVRASLPAIRSVGCCPPGDPNGQVYKTGYSCCVGEVYKASTHFCCIDKKRILEMNQSNLDYCYPTDQTPFCREIDLDVASKNGMETQCDVNSNGHPTKCNITCITGTNAKPVQSVTCLANGIWNETPQCCEGCASDYKRDLWFLVQLSDEIGWENFDYIKSFLKTSISYFPLSQESVRVAVTTYNNVVFTDQDTWYLNEYQSEDQLFGAIDNLPFEGRGSSLGKALRWLTENAFIKAKGGRENVKNTLVILMTGEPTDNISNYLSALHAISEEVIIGIGDGIKDSTLTALSNHNKDNVIKLSSFEELENLPRFLYLKYCEEKCI